jgi:hypothetical protein
MGRDGKTHHRHQQNADETKVPVTNRSVLHGRLLPFGLEPHSPSAWVFRGKHPPCQGFSHHNK